MTGSQVVWGGVGVGVAGGGGGGRETIPNSTLTPPE